MRLLRRSPRLSAEAESRLAEHRERADGIVQGIRREYVGSRGEPGGPWDMPAAQQLPHDDELALSALVVVAAFDENVQGSGAHFDWDTSFVRQDLQAHLVRRKLPYTRADVELLTALAERKRAAAWWWLDLARCRIAVAALERYASDHGAGEVAKEIDRMKAVIARQEGSDWTSLGVRLRRLVPDFDKVDLSALVGKDPWTKKVRPVVERDYRRHGALLSQLGSATSSRPTKKWLGQTGELLDEEGRSLVRFLLESTFAVDSKEIGRQVWEGRTYVQMLWLSDPSATLVRGCLWTTALIEDEWVVPIASAIFERSRAEEEIKVANAALYALGESDREEAIALLSRLAARVKDRRFLKGIEKALERAAEKRGLTRSALRESLVPAFELGPDGSREIAVGDAVATIRVDPPGTVATTWTTEGGRAQKTAPVDVRENHADALKAVKSLATEIRKELGVQRLRVEGLLAEERVWSYDDWRKHYLEHPLVRAFTPRLVWRFDDTAAIPLEDGFLVADGSTATELPAEEVRLWHPIHAGPDEVARWRQVIRERELVQPFKQAFREVYVLAPAEEQTETYSNRFAAHIVRYPQVYALTKQRGWGGNALGPYDNDGGRQWREFDEQGLRVEFWMEHAEHDFVGMESIAELAATDQVRFYRRSEREPARLAEVPPVVFSEAMRDVDLFVGVASIAADPEWIDRGNDRYDAYWREASFGELGQSALVRHELLESLLPTLRIADRCTLEERYLVVRGTRRTYRIHLGSANILMEPNDEYLCIVPARGSKAQKVYLPFPEDERFSVILSKAFLLAADDRITDRTILRQIERR